MTKLVQMGVLNLIWNDLSLKYYSGFKDRGSLKMLFCSLDLVVFHEDIPSKLQIYEIFSIYISAEWPYSQYPGFTLDFLTLEVRLCLKLYVYTIQIALNTSVHNLLTPE